MEKAAGTLADILVKKALWKRQTGIFTDMP